MNQPDCIELNFQNIDEFKKWYCRYEWRPYSLDKSEAECSALAYYLHAVIMGPNSSIRWPILSKKTESPDFLVISGMEATVGLEHSTITSKKYQRFRSESLKKLTEDVIWLDSFKLAGPPTLEVNQGWVGDEPEREWGELALIRIMKKLAKLNKSHFQRLERNELILNTVTYLPNLNMQHAISLLGERLKESMAKADYRSTFDSISFIYGTRTYLHALVKK